MGQRLVSLCHGNDLMDNRATSWLQCAGCEVVTRRPFRGETPGAPRGHGGPVATIVHGGPIIDYKTDRHPFLREEYDRLDAYLKPAIKVLGNCHGAQMIAHRLGAGAGARAPEIFDFGYDEIAPSTEVGNFLTAQLIVTQTDSHTFDLPGGAVRLAGNDNDANQGVHMDDRAYGLQVHPAVTPEDFRRWQDMNPNARDLLDVQNGAEQDRLQARHDAAQGAWFEGSLEPLVGCAA